jgi:Holliday junction DNA helicase RuvA
MISTVRGTVRDIALDHVVIEIGGAASGVGLAVRTTPGVLAGLRTDTETTLATVLMVREDALTLYGFPDSAARELFLLLQTVPGIGPRVALATLAVFTPDQLRRALTNEETTTLTRVPGIGRKGAERLIIELRDQVSPPAAVGATPPAGAGSPAAASTGARAHVVQALVGLGFTAGQAEQAVSSVTTEDPPESALDPARTLRAALAHLGPRR